MLTSNQRYSILLQHVMHGPPVHWRGLWRCVGQTCSQGVRGVQQQLKLQQITAACYAWATSALGKPLEVCWANRQSGLSVARHFQCVGSAWAVDGPSAAVADIARLPAYVAATAYCPATHNLMLALGTWLHWHSTW
jgi:hypothetical protein